MLFKFVVLVMLAMIVSMLVMLLLRTQEDSAEPVQQEKQELSADAKRAEKKFSEGVLNVLNYENPMERGRGE